MDGDIDILRPLGTLSIGIFSPLFKPVIDGFLSPSDRSRAPICQRCGHLLTIDEQPCICIGSNGNALSAQPSPNGGTAYAKALRYGSQRLAGEIAGTYFREVNPEPETAIFPDLSIGSRYGGVFSTRASNASFFENVPYTHSMGMEYGGDLFHREARSIELDNVIFVGLRTWCGYVYNLSTPYGYFTANGLYTGNTLRAYREATRRNYQANSDIIAGWRWLAAKQARTCVMCLAMDGSFHTNDEELDDHPNGRCAYVPVLRGEEGDGPQWETGAEWLEKSNEDIQRQVLGDAGYEAYKAGAVTLRDYVGQKHDKDWGSTRYARSLKEILGKEGAQRWGQIARWEKLPDEKLIPALVRSEIEPTPHLLERVQGYVAGRGFDPQRMQLVDKQVAGHEWKGRLLRENDLLPTLEQHYLKHVVARQEWAEGTTITEYVQTAEDVIRNAESGILAAKVRNRWHMFFVDRVPDVRPHTGSDWVVVQYAVSEGYWWSAYRLWRGVEQLTGLAEREGNRWLRLLPKRES